MSKEKKTRSITIRVTDSEYMKIESGADSMGMNITQYINYLSHLKYIENIDRILLDRK